MASSPTQNTVDVMFLCHGYEGEAARDFVGAYVRGVFSCPFAFSKIGTDIKHREVIMINRTRIIVLEIGLNLCDLRSKWFFRSCLR